MSFFAINSFPINFQQTTRSSSLTFEKLEDARTQHSHIKNDHDFVFTFGLSSVQDPLIIKNTSRSLQVQEIISRLSSAQLGVSIYLKKWLMLGLEGEFSNFTDFKGAHYTGFNDFNFKSKFRLLNKKRWALSLMPFISIPSNQGKYQVTGLPTYPRVNNLKFSVLSDQAIGYGATLISEYIFNWAQVVLNIAYKKSQKALISDNTGLDVIDFRDQLITGLGGYIPINNAWGINIEWSRRWTSPFLKSKQAQNELFLGSAIGITKSLHSYAGVGFGNLLTNNDGNDLRFSLGLKFTHHLFQKPKRKLRAVLKSEILNNLKNNQKIVNFQKRTQTNSLKKSAPPSCETMKFFGSSDVAILRFKVNKYTFNPESDEIIKLLNYINNNKHFIDSIILEAHTSKRGLKKRTKKAYLKSKKFNFYLSKKRLLFVRKLILNQGIDKKIIKSRAFGQTKNVDKNRNSKAHRRNRRVEILISTNDYFKKNCQDLVN